MISKKKIYYIYKKKVVYLQEVKVNNLVIDFVDYCVLIKYLYDYENAKKV